MKTLRIFFICVVLAGGLFGQNVGPKGGSAVIPFAGVPSGTCPATALAVNTTNGNLYACNGGAWLLIGPGAAGSATWNTLIAPTGNQSITMAAFTSTWTYNAATGAGVNLFTITDTASNTGTGVMAIFNTASGSALKPFQASANGNGVQVSTAGVLAALGTGHVNADQVAGAAPATSAVVLGSNVSNQLVAATTTGSGTTVPLATSPVLTTPKVTTINDANGNPFIASTATASAVDSVTVTNSATANPATVTVSATGSDSNINLNLVSKGTGTVQCNGSSCGGGGSSAISSLTAATTTNSPLNGNNAQTWNWALTGAGVIGMLWDESAASTGGTAGVQAIGEFSTAAGSTATPLIVNNSLNGSQTLAALLINPTWNTTGVVDAALKINPTNTASGAGSLLFDAQLGGTSEAKIDKAGNMTLAGALNTNAGSNLCGASSPCWGGVEGATAPTPAATNDFLFMSNTHCVQSSSNGGTLECLPTVNGSWSSGNLLKVNTATGGSTQPDIADTGVAAANVVTAASAATAAKQICVSGGATKTCSYIDFPEVLFIPAANCNNTTAGAGWSIGSGGSVTCRAGTNNKGGFIAITDTSTTFATFQIEIPEDWDTGSNPFIRFQIASTDTTTGHTIIPSIQVACYKGDGTTTDDVAPNAAHSLSTITTNTTANQFWSTSNVQMNATDVTGCVAGALMQITVGRATDTATNAEFYGATVTFPRLLTVQAN